MPTKISWTDEVWNVVTGCTPASPGCDHCYAKRMAGRFLALYPEGFSKVTCHPDRLDIPLHWKKPKRIFVCSMGDLFHPRVPWEFVAQVFDVMKATPQHTFQVLTKRPGRMIWFAENICHRTPGWPSNVWAGVTVESGKYLPRLDVLARLLGHVKTFVSLEPLLGEVNILPWIGQPDSNHAHYKHSLSLVIVGGESGPGARPSHPDWFRKVRDDCQEAGVPFHFKGWGEWVPYEQWGRRGRNNDSARDYSTRYVSIDGTVRQRAFNQRPDESLVVRVGRAAAGHLLDGVEHREMP